MTNKEDENDLRSRVERNIGDVRFHCFEIWGRIFNDELASMNLETAPSNDCVFKFIRSIYDFKMKSVPSIWVIKTLED